MSLLEGFKGAQVELAGISSLPQKFWRLAGITSIFAKEIVGTFAMVPYGVRALRTYKGVVEVAADDDVRARRRDQVSVIRNVRYGNRKRNVMDIYLPTTPEPATASLPVALFCHGGVWATGDSWHYAPMAVRLAQSGVITCVATYTLYPEVLVPVMTEEMSAALTWTLDNASRLGGDPARVSLVGHSAGAQMCAMALLHRATAASAGARKATANGHVDPDCDDRMPCRFIGLAGVYDISKHFYYEASYGVEELSTMKRAIGGPTNFAQQSPAVILAQALQRHHSQEASDAASAPEPHHQSNGPSFYESFPLQGEAIAHRIGFERGGTGMAAVLSQVAAGDGGEVLQMTLEEAQRLPPCILMSSCTDTVVPWYESAEMFWMLLDCGCPVKHLVYNKVGHGDFVTSWWRAPDQEAASLGHDLSATARDLMLVLSGRTQVKYMCKPNACNQ